VLFFKERYYHKYTKFFLSTESVQLKERYSKTGSERCRADQTIQTARQDAGG
jgi:hypothetical protein